MSTRTITRLSTVTRDDAKQVTTQDLPVVSTSTNVDSSIAEDALDDGRFLSLSLLEFILVVVILAVVFIAVLVVMVVAFCCCLHIQHMRIANNKCEGK